MQAGLLSFHPSYFAMQLEIITLALITSVIASPQIFGPNPFRPSVLTPFSFNPSLLNSPIPSTTNSYGITSVRINSFTINSGSINPYINPVSINPYVDPFNIQSFRNHPAATLNPYVNPFSINPFNTNPAIPVGLNIHPYSINSLGTKNVGPVVSGGTWRSNFERFDLRDPANRGSYFLSEDVDGDVIKDSRQRNDILDAENPRTDDNLGGGFPRKGIDAGLISYHLSEYEDAISPAEGADFESNLERNMLQLPQYNFYSNHPQHMSGLCSAREMYRVTPRGFYIINNIYNDFRSGDRSSGLPQGAATPDAPVSAMGAKVNPPTKGSSLTSGIGPSKIKRTGQGPTKNKPVTTASNVSSKDKDGSIIPTSGKSQKFEVSKRRLLSTFPRVSSILGSIQPLFAEIFTPEILPENPPKQNTTAIEPLSGRVDGSGVKEPQMVTIRVKNNCKWPLWPAVQTTGGSPQVNNSGFKLESMEDQVVEVPPTWKGRIWTRTQCDSPNRICVTGDCGAGEGPCNGTGGKPPMTVAEFALGDNGLHTYYMSLVEGYNSPMTITPEGGTGPRCVPASCNNWFSALCPPRMSVRTPEGFVGCKSACAALRGPEDCCKGNFSSPQTCEPTIYSKMFKEYCPDARSYVHDNTTYTYNCYGSPNYVVSFCPI